MSRKPENAARKRAGLVQILILAAVTVSCSRCCMSPSRDGLAPTVTKAGLKSVRLGMNREQLASAIGRPIAEEKETSGRRRLDYAKAVITTCPYPMVWVYLRDDVVDEVYVKIYHAGSDLAVYSLVRDRSWEGPDFAAALPE